MKILCIGGATQDLFLECEGTNHMTIEQEAERHHYMLFESGQKIEITNIAYHTGGGGTNSAVAFARLGFQSTIFCHLGNDHDAEIIKKILHNENVCTDFITITDQQPTGRSFIINAQQGERTIFANRGANSFLKLDSIMQKDLSTYNQLYITSLSNQSTSMLASLCAQAKQYKIPIAINPGTSQLRYDLLTLKNSLTNIDILIMNDIEAKMFMVALTQTDDIYKHTLKSNMPRPTNACSNKRHEAFLVTQPLLHQDFCFSTRKFFNEVINLGPKIVVITNGCNGVYVATNKTIYFYPSLNINVVDSVGAGDSFGSTFVACIARKKNIEYALRAGIANSASVLSHVGAKTGLLTNDELENATNKLTLNRLQTFDL